jgi:hypothetical protein
MAGLGVNHDVVVEQIGRGRRVALVERRVEPAG